ncbi:MAG: glutathione S-transferase family protein [Tistlia sp.]|uniref:glutathione S-transferase family protein n=1 Tax=Tistlia sp. TaxID=3057121 RepID=UPI0034A47F4E
MKLFYSRNSPYARIARIAALESGRTDIEMVRVQNRAPDSPLLAYSPVCRVPTLVDGELVLGEAANVWRYLRSLSDSGRPERRGWPEVAFESMALGFLEGIAAWVREHRREPAERSAFLIEIERRRAGRCLAYFDQRVEAGAAAPWDLAQVALVCGLDLMDHYRLVEEWEVDHHRLFAWLDEQRRRPAAKATRPAD